MKYWPFNRRESADRISWYSHYAAFVNSFYLRLLAGKYPCYFLRCLGGDDRFLSRRSLSGGVSVGSTLLEGAWDQRQRLPCKEHGTRQPDRKWHDTETSLPMDRMTDTNENNTLPQTSFASGKNLKWSKNVQNLRLLALCCAFVVWVLNKYGCTVCKQRTTIIHCFKLSWEGNVTRFLVDWRKVNFLILTTL